MNYIEKNLFKFIITKLPHTNIIVMIPVCKFCGCGTFKMDGIGKRFKCFICRKIYFLEDGVWYYSNSRGNKECKTKHLV